jgi:predicted secreted hydrolase
VEWWYLTGWLTTERHEQLGFQITFFRTRIANADTHDQPERLRRHGSC